MAWKSVKAVLLDLNGTLHVGDAPTQGAVLALKRLRMSGIPVRFVTNTTKESRRALKKRLDSIGFGIELNEIYTALRAAHSLIRQRHLRPYYIMEDDALLEEFSDLPRSGEADGSDASAVVVALAPSKFDYATMNRAFRILQAGNPLIAIHKARLYKRPDGLALGPGPFVEALEYASGVRAEVVGKPEIAFFRACMDGLNCSPDEVVMIGDDVRDDVRGAMDAGLRAVLVRTGKYRSGDDSLLENTGGVACDTFASAVDMLLGDDIS
ncbi:haloacid dehalogenase-like hydrolase domain-containing protein 2 [Sycon ciliatum]|uniref:haloacid dehalogenase-like hydrolase domain-containing protein 2 n=1 Tax=Sycon ciliatum TaxID=27933 RepID=UPI0031F71B54